MKYLSVCVSLFLFNYSVAVVQVTIKEADGYYWRDYNGEIPSDAVPGGSDKYGSTTYIGQALHIGPVNGKLVPGKINESDKKLYYAWQDNAYGMTHNVKILCSQNPEKFEWVTTDINRAKSLPRNTLVVGGYDTSYDLYIGRIHAEGEVSVGKVTLTEPYDAIGYVANGKPYFVKTSFEVLVYDPKKEYTNNSCPAERIINIQLE